MVRKSLLLAFFVVLTFSIVAQANKCTDVLFTAFANPYINPESEFHIDSSYFNENGNEWTHKYIYENGKLVQTQYDTKEEGKEIRILPFYNDTNKTVLKNKGVEYIVSKCQANDTLCFQEDVYSDGEYAGVKTTKFTSNYITVEQIEEGIKRFSEYILVQDSVIEKRYFDYNTDSVRASQILYVADSTDESKCYQLREDGGIDYSIVYKSFDKKFSLSVEKETYIREFFFIKNDGATSIRKTLKPVKISPKMRYFDLLGRYKFSK